MIFLISTAAKNYSLRVTCEFAIPLIPPVTFSAWFSCSMSWLLPIAVNGIPDLFTETLPPPSQHLTEPKCFRLFLSVHTLVPNKQGSCVHSSAYQKQKSMVKADLNFTDEVSITVLLMSWWKAEWLQKDPCNRDKTLLDLINSNQTDFVILRG